MSGYGELNLEGIEGFIQYEYTRGEVFSDYHDAAAVVAGVAQANATPQNIGALNFALNSLINLFKTGKQLKADPSDPNSYNRQYFITSEMATQLDMVLKSLEVVDVDPTQTINMDVTTANQWLSFVNGTSFLQGFYAIANDPDSQLHSFQTIVELQYVKTGNDVISGQMQDLQTALGTAKSVLSNLSNLQELHNEISVYNRGSFTSITGFDWTGVNKSPTDYVKGYQTAASGFYGDPIVPVIPNSPFVLPDYLGWFLTQIQGGLQVGVTVNNVAYFTLPTGVTPPAGFISTYLVTSTTPNVYTISPRPSDGGSQATSDLFLRDLQKVTNLMNGTKYPVTLSGTEYRLGIPSGDAVGLNFAIDTYHLTQIGLDDLKNQLVKARNDLDAQIAAIQALSANPGSSSVSPASQGSTNALLSKLQTIRADFSSVFITQQGQEITSATSMYSAYSGLYNWLIDKYDQRNTANSQQAGALQKNIIAGIVSSQSLNDAKKADVQNFLYVFKEYYKSASAILQQLGQIIQHAAESIQGR